ncbi:MAG TPA: hypothetical protein VEP46_00230 [Vicinamibacterales bacterium]|nr:hypothetical protein [Vicinamibacterales bacterium]
MRNRMFRTAGVLIIAMIVALSVAVLVAQTPSGKKELPKETTDPEVAIKAAADAFKAANSLKAYAVPKTPWGDPDLRGVWNTATYTRLQRPEELGSKAFYTEEEAIAEYKKAAESDAEVDPRTVHYDWKEYAMDAWQGGTRPNLRTSLIVDPENGRLPPLVPEAQQRRAAAAAAARQRDPAAGIKTFGNLYTRCVLGLGAIPLVRGGMPGADSAAAAAGVTAEAFFFQSPGYLTIVMQSNNDVRIIPVDSHPHVPGQVRQWLGDSRGHWEGTTLVVETTNFSDPKPATNFLGSTDALQLVERFARVGPNTLRYQYTVTDPKTWTRPWSVDTTMPRIDPSLIYEFACHEQNYGLMNVVTGTQIREREGTRDMRGGTFARPPE